MLYRSTQHHIPEDCNLKILCCRKLISVLTFFSFRVDILLFEDGVCSSQMFCFRPGFVVLDLEDVPAGTYNIVPSTFMPNQEGPFILTVKASCPFSLARLQ